ncbi:BapA prefix-like domain-containing protein [Erwinia sorbitola]|uniref:BapA prefix-like domain-containing protein n=1 Tax=Erwinia sorbitola TaxID=2681984 RepID=A0A6I6EAV7_9GAMM|nr:Ig-like domain-containing protein [Erwinia sorbitola]MTD28657.1 BapA prefix-like domain-containing protein [Erwinia sorbitola]QGU86887.1 BapA prefix-like domain-containing protein [Erwinia sorbitola]
MTQPASGFVEILSRDSGKLLSQSQPHTSDTVILSQPSVVKIHGLPASVADYQQQGDDLILHMRDGSTVRYQHFFTASDGEQSELLFDDGVNPPQHALFSSGLQTTDAATPLTPAFQAMSSADPLLTATAETESGGTMTAMGLGLLGLAGIGGGVALASNHSGSDDSSSQSTSASGGETPVVTVPDTGTSTDPDSGTGSGTGSSTPSLTVTPLTGDGVISADERHSDQTFGGTSANIAPGSALTITLNAHTYSTQVASDGSWSVTLPAADLEALPDGSNTVSISFANASGGTSTANKTITVEPLSPMGEPPHPTIDLPFGDGTLNSAEQAVQQTLTGTTGSTGSGQKVVVTLGEESYNATVDNDGNWTLNPDPYTLYQMGEGERTIEVTATDAWGQQGSTSTPVIIDLTAPNISIDDVSGDNVIDASEIHSDMLVGGSTTLSEAGRNVDLLFNGVSYHTQVNSSGDWHLAIPASALQGLEDKAYRLEASISDEAGNSSKTTHTVTLAASADTLPSLSIDPISTDNAVSYREGIYGLEMWGTSSHLPAGTVVTLDIAGKTYTGGVGSDGIWQVMIHDDELAAITDGKYTFNFSATDPNGNSTSASRDVLLLTHYSSKIGYTVDDITPADVSVVDGQEYVTISGTFADTFPINLISIKVDDYPNYSATLTNDGHWSVTVPLAGSNIHDGLNFIIFGTSDGAGNWVEQTNQIHVDLGQATDSSSLNLATLGLSQQQDDALAIASTAEDHSTLTALALSDVSPVTLSTTGSGVWSQPVSRVESGQISEVYHAPLQESTLADVLTQHQLQLHNV